MDSYSFVKVHNSQRTQKLDRKKEAESYVMTPPKMYSKLYVWNKYRKLE